MGEGMAARLLSQGVAGGDETTPLVVWNRTPSKCEALKASFPDKNIVVKDSPKQVVEACDITYCMLSTPEASRAVFEGDDGVLAGVSEGKSIVDCATLAEEDMIRMHDAVVEKGGYVFGSFLRNEQCQLNSYSYALYLLQAILGSTRVGIQGSSRAGYTHFSVCRLALVV